VKLDATATIKDAKVKSDYNGNRLALTFELALPRPVPIVDFDHWRELFPYQDGPASNQPTYDAKGKKEKKQPPAPEHLRKEYDTYTDKQQRANRTAVAGALRAGILLALIGTQVRIQITPAQGAMLELLALPAGPDLEDDDDQGVPAITGDL
jgi:hypothetical protein